MCHPSAGRKPDLDLDTRTRIVPFGVRNGPGRASTESEPPEIKGKTVHVFRCPINAIEGVDRETQSLLSVFGTAVSDGVSPWASGSGFSADCMCMAVDGMLFKLRVIGTTVSGGVAPWCASGSGFSADCICMAVDGVLFYGLRVFGTAVSGGFSP